MSESQAAARERASREVADAWRRGQAALVANDPANAQRWLTRAARLAPDDEAVALGLASACLGTDPARAAVLFARLVHDTGAGEAWFGLAAARLRAGEAAASAAALASGLARHAGSDALHALADAVCQACGLPGWCMASLADGRLTLRLSSGAPPATVLIDGRTVAFVRHATTPVSIPLPPDWHAARRLDVRAGPQALLGSPLEPRAIARVEGCVSITEAGGIEGWAWHPGDPRVDPALRVSAAAAPAAGLDLVAHDPADLPAGGHPLMRPRRVQLAAAALGRLPAGPLRITGSDRRDLLGSPLDLRAALRPTRAARMPAAQRPAPQPPRQRGVAIVIPVHEGGAVALDCIAAVCATVGPEAAVIVVDDASVDPALLAALDRLAETGAIGLLRQPRNRGFAASANLGVLAAGERDVVLLNSDTTTPPGWLDRLRTAAYAAPDIGTASPLSNDATILSYPAAHGGNAVPDTAATARLDRLATAANAGAVVDIPTGVGFCLFVRRDCLATVGLFRADLFAQGYGEENDFCMRARARGWRHVAAASVYVAHRGAASFGAARTHLKARNAAVLARAHPEYEALVAAHVASDPLAPARRGMDALRWAAAPASDAVLLVTHGEGGGVERHIVARCAAIRAEGRRPVVLRPAPDGGVAVDAEAGDASVEDAFPNLHYSTEREWPAFAALLRRSRPERIEFHHLLGHAPALLCLPQVLGIPYAVHIHDFAWFCPRVLLVRAGAYCGEPDLAGCEACIAAEGRLIEEDIGVAALCARSARFLRGATRVTAPSHDAARRLQRHFPGLAIEVTAPEPEPPSIQPATAATGGPLRVCVVGAIGVAKGYDVLLATAQDAERRRLPLEFVVVGQTIDDAALHASGRVFVTGRYRAAEAVPLIREQRAHLGWLPSVAPETWCYALSEMWRAGLDVAASDFGAPAERLRRRARGWLLPPGLDASSLNDALLAAASPTRHERPSRSDIVDCARLPAPAGRRTESEILHVRRART